MSRRVRETFSVIDQRVAYKLACEGFEILKVVPSTKYADEARFLFYFRDDVQFRNRFVELVTEFKKKDEKSAAKSEKICEEIRDNFSENPKKCEKITENCEKNGENSEKTVNNEAETPVNCEKSLAEVLDRLATLEALGNCILTNVSASNFFAGLHNNKEG